MAKYYKQRPEILQFILDFSANMASYYKHNSDTTGRGTAAARGVAITGGGNLVLRVLDIIVAVLILKWLSVFEFGVYRLILAAQGFFNIFFIPGLRSVIISDVSGSINSSSSEPEGRFWLYIVFNTFIGILLWGLFFFASGIIAGWFGAEEYIYYLRVISFIFLLAPFDAFYKIRFQISLDFGWSAFYNILHSLFRLMVLVAAFFLGAATLSAVLWSLVISNTIAIFAAVLFYKRPYSLKPPSARKISDLIKILFPTHARWSIVSNFISDISYNLRLFVIQFFAGTEAVGLFSLAQNILSYTRTLFPVREVLMPVIPRVTKKRVDLADKINRATKYATWGFALISIASAVAVPLLVMSLFPKYEAALPIFFWLLLGNLFMGFRSVAPPLFFALKAQSVLVKISIVRFFGSMTILIVLAYFFGLWGAVVELLITGVLAILAYGWGIKKMVPQWKISLGQFFTYDRYDQIMKATIFARINKRLPWHTKNNI